MGEERWQDEMGWFSGLELFASEPSFPLPCCDLCGPGAVGYISQTPMPAGFQLSSVRGDTSGRLKNIEKASVVGAC